MDKYKDYWAFLYGDDENPANEEPPMEEEEEETPPMIIDYGQIEGEEDHSIWEYIQERFGEPTGMKTVPERW